VISSLDSLEPQSNIFIDTNIFLYGAMDYSKYRAACRAFLQNIESGTYFAATSALVLNEIVHKLILAETTKTYRLRSESEAKKLIEDSRKRSQALRGSGRPTL
jgi:predicted nucleic acid-binding protein